MNRQEKGKNPTGLSVLDLLRPITQVEPLEEEVIADYITGTDTAEAVQEVKQEQVAEQIPDDDFIAWLDNVRQRPKLQGDNRGFIYLDKDVVNTFVALKEVTAMPANHVISCILSDWIDAQKDNLTKLLRERKRKKILIDV